MTPPHPALPHPHPEPVASLGRLPLLTLPQLSESETHNLALNYTLCSLIILCLISAARVSSGSQIALPGSGLHEACASCPPGAGKGALDGSLEPTVPHGWAWTRRGRPSAPSARFAQPPARPPGPQVSSASWTTGPPHLAPDMHGAALSVPQARLGPPPSRWTVETREPPTGHPPPAAEEGGHPSTPSPQQMAPGQMSLSLQALGRGGGAGGAGGGVHP